MQAELTPTHPTLQTLDTLIQNILMEKFSKNKEDISTILSNKEKIKPFLKKLFERIIKRDNIVLHNIKAVHYQNIYTPKTDPTRDFIKKLNRYDTAIHEANVSILDDLPNVTWKQILQQDHTEEFKQLCTSISQMVVSILHSSVQSKHPKKINQAIPNASSEGSAHAPQTAQSLRTSHFATSGFLSGLTPKNFSIKKRTPQELMQKKVKAVTSGFLAQAIDWFSGIKTEVKKFPYIHQFYNRDVIDRLWALYSSFENLSSKIPRIIVTLGTFAICNQLIITLLLPLVIDTILAATAAMFGIAAINYIVLYVNDEILFHLIPHRYGNSDLEQVALMPRFEKELKDINKASSWSVREWRDFLIPLYYEKLKIPSTTTDAEPSQSILKPLEEVGILPQDSDRDSKAAASYHGEEDGYESSHSVR